MLINQTGMSEALDALNICHHSNNETNIRWLTLKTIGLLFKNDDLKADLIKNRICIYFRSFLSGREP